jgi:peptidoglycan/LPS O-acetylase OafA/YrhL
MTTASPHGPAQGAVPRKSKKFEVLESIRGLAAIYVLLGHFLNFRGLGGHHLGVLLRFGQEAVMVFFILSGFVICYSVRRHHDISFRTYFSRRFNRIYPIFLLCLLVSYAVACEAAGCLLPLHVPQLLGNVFMLQDMAILKPGVWFNTYYGDDALWSLSYEWWFYMMFYPINRYILQGRQKYLVGGLSLAGLAVYLLWPNQISLFLLYFSIWWVGVEVARTYTSGVRPTLKSQKASLLILAGLTGLLLCHALYSWKVLGRHLDFGFDPILELRHFAAALLLVLIALSLSPNAWGRLRRVLRPMAVLAPISYALYVLHVPLAAEGRYLAFIPSVPAQLLGYLVITFAAAYFAEFPFQRWVTSFWPKSPDTISTAHDQ